MNKYYFVQFILGLFLNTPGCGLLSFPLCLYTNEQDNNKWHIFFFTLGYFTYMLHWIVQPLLFDLNTYWWLVPLAMLGLPVILSSFYSFLGWLKYSNRTVNTILFAAGWYYIEEFRSYGIVPFPWLLLGYLSDFSLIFCQIVKIIGIEMMGFVLIIISCVFYVKNRYYTVFCCILVMCNLLYGYIQLQKNISIPGNFYLIQPNHNTFQLSDDDKINNLKSILNLMPDKTEGLNFIILPENAIQFFIDKNTKHLRYFLHDKNYSTETYIITGIDIIDIKNNEYEFFNSMILMDYQGNIKYIYKKEILAPFGEYIPLRKIFSNLPSVATTIDFQPGHDQELMQINNIAVKPVICYEMIFKQGKYNADFIINITNDIWIGKGAYQHFRMAKLRAIEKGLPLIRTSNNGISAIIDAQGRILKQTNLNHKSLLHYSK